MDKDGTTGARHLVGARPVKYGLRKYHSKRIENWGVKGACPFPITKFFVPGCPRTGMEKRYFLLRLIPPRPTFATDMDAEERQVMLAHGAFLRQYVESGTIIVMGPVQDPAGPWGLAVFEAGSEDEVRSIVARDPTVLSGRGFRWEIYPMLQAIVRK